MYWKLIIDFKIICWIKSGVAQVKIMKNPDLLQTASEQFLGKKEHEIKSTVLQTLEGHLRAILGKSYSTFSKIKLVNWFHASVIIAYLSSIK